MLCVARAAAAAVVDGQNVIYTYAAHKSPVQCKGGPLIIHKHISPEQLKCVCVRYTTRRVSRTTPQQLIIASLMPLMLKTILCNNCFNAFGFLYRVYTSLLTVRMKYIARALRYYIVPRTGRKRLQVGGCGGSGVQKCH